MSGIDWNGLFKWSVGYSDQTAPSEFKEMSKADKEFIEAAMKEMCLSETD